MKNKKENKKEVPHSLPADFKEAIDSKMAVARMWQDITPLARNEWICWVESAKKLETRQRRIKIALSKLSSGEKRPCCWAGCPHRGNKIDSF